MNKFEQKERLPTIQLTLEREYGLMDLTHANQAITAAMNNHSEEINEDDHEGLRVAAQIMADCLRTYYHVVGDEIELQRYARLK